MIGDLNGDANFLHNGQVVAANAKVFAQIVAALRPHVAQLTRERAALAPPAAR